MFVFGLCSTSDDWPSDPSTKHQPKHKKNEKGPLLSYQKIKCLFLDYIQLLMIGRAIRAKNVDQTQKNKMFIFGLHSTFDDWLSHLSDER